jgi:hypothetical protein
MTRHELADVMIKGLHTPNVREERMTYISASEKRPPCKACALGCALIGKLDGNIREAERIYHYKDRTETVKTTYDIFGDLLGISPELALEIEFKHLNGMPIQQIATWLKTSEGEGEKWQKD